MAKWVILPNTTLICFRHSPLSHGPLRHAKLTVSYRTGSWAELAARVAGPCRAGPSNLSTRQPTGPSSTPPPRLASRSLHASSPPLAGCSLRVPPPLVGRPSLRSPQPAHADRPILCVPPPLAGPSRARRASLAGRLQPAAVHPPTASGPPCTGRRRLKPWCARERGIERVECGG